MTHAEQESSRILEDCLTRLQGGTPLSAILAELREQHPQYAELIRGELETVLTLWEVRGSDTVPLHALQRSRLQLMNLAREYQTIPRPPRWKVLLYQLEGQVRKPHIWIGVVVAILVILAAMLALKLF